MSDDTWTGEHGGVVEDVNDKEGEGAPTGGVAKPTHLSWDSPHIQTSSLRLHNIFRCRGVDAISLAVSAGAGAAGERKLTAG
ncbi:hypothetical protein EVAR_38196_1 [Eumeta japonica]|uniref:Uncharacterized protein n=1 Tax=Eumeta variegata TaxID=151549 RepID=A0A4C1WDI8_EUMVA|nr:hypothetical protein EVAR_38196_1 [Eumeta japonica]